MVNSYPCTEGRNAATIQTAEGRFQMLRDMAKQFSRHLETVPGAILTPDQRLFVVHEARFALLSCPASIKHHRQQIEPSGTCFMPKGVYKRLVSLAPYDEHVDNEKAYAKSFTHHDSELITCLKGIVRSVVHFQSAINEHWYRDAIQALKATGSIATEFKSHTTPDLCEDSEMKLTPYYSALAEIIVLTAMSHAIHVVFLALDEDVPPLPKTCAATGPSNINFSFLFKVPSVPFDKRVLEAAPLLTWKNIDTSSNQLHKFRDSTVKKLPTIIDPMKPHCAIAMAPEDFVMFTDYVSSCYLNPNPVVRLNF